MLQVPQENSPLLMDLLHDINKNRPGLLVLRYLNRG
jgi:hypothetical protein